MICIEKIVRYEITCECCDTSEHVEGGNLKDAIKDFRLNGWMIKHDGTALCEQCRNEKD